MLGHFDAKRKIVIFYFLLLVVFCISKGNCSSGRNKMTSRIYNWLSETEKLRSGNNPTMRVRTYAIWQVTADCTNDDFENLLCFVKILSIMFDSKKSWDANLDTISVLSSSKFWHVKWFWWKNICWDSHSLKKNNPLTITFRNLL